MKGREEPVLLTARYPAEHTRRPSALLALPELLSLLPGRFSLAGALQGAQASSNVPDVCGIGNALARLQAVGPAAEQRLPRKIFSCQELEVMSALEVCQIRNPCTLLSVKY